MKKFCPSCGRETNHSDTWLDEITNQLLPPIPFSRSAETYVRGMVEMIAHTAGIARMRVDFKKGDIEPRSWCFIEEMKKRGARVSALYGPAGFTNNFTLTYKGKTVKFDMLPVADFANKKIARAADDKKKTKELLAKGRFPVASGTAFWFWEKKSAIAYAQRLGFPLVVKPRNGSVSRHVTTNIQNQNELEKAISYALQYSPSFIVEKFIPGALYRATVIDFTFAGCVKQIPARVVGDGTATIRQLIDQKNSNPERGGLEAKHTTLHQLAVNDATKMLLSEKQYTEGTVLKKGEVFHLQRDPFLKWGGDLEEVSAHVHPDNIKLFEDAARYFDIRAVGMDFITHDITQSWKEAPSAILELNSMPDIDLHHSPTDGTPTNPAKALADMFTKYYL